MDLMKAIKDGWTTDQVAGLDFNSAPQQEPDPDLEDNGKRLDFNNAPPQIDDDDKPVLKVEQMTICQHGQPCRHLTFNGRNFCSAADQPVWDLSKCPLEWWAPRQRKLTEKVKETVK